MTGRRPRGRRGRPAPPTGRASGGRTSRAALPIALALAALAAVTLLSYSGVYDHSFVRWDDPTYVEENPLVLNQQTGPLLRAVVAGNYHPVTMLSLAANASSPLSPRPFLATNVLLHVLNTGLVFWLSYLLFRRRALPAFLVALFFAVHPMHVESVAWVSERKDVLYAFFFLAAAIAYYRYLETKARAWLGAAFALFVLSCLSKAVAVTFPAVMLLLDAWKGRNVLDRRGLLEKAPFVAASVLVGLIAISAQAGGDFHGLFLRGSDSATALPETFPFTPFQRVAFPAYGHLQYVWKLFVPTGLAAFYPYPATIAESYQPKYFVAILFLLASVAIFAWSLRRSRVLAFGMGWYFATLLPVMQWIPVGSAVMADRYSYLPYVGLFFILAAGVAAWIDRRPMLQVPVLAALALAAAALIVVTVRQVATWKDTETLWSAVIRSSPNSDKAYAARGNFRGRSGRVQEAMSDLMIARRLNPNRAEVYEDLGNAYGILGNVDSALVLFDQALRIDPKLGHTYSNRAIAYLRMGRAQDALADLARAEELMPSDAASLHFPRGNAYLMLGQPSQAADEFGRAIESGSGGADAYTNRGIARSMLGDTAGAADDFNAALRLNPNHPEARARLEALGHTQTRRP